MLKSIKILSRSSCLAKIQARLVGYEICRQFPDIDVCYSTMKSDGDLDQLQSISSGNITGLFTKNISKSIEKGEHDIAVHSWKDVPLEPTSNTKIYGTIDRGDMRDILFIKKECLEDLDRTELKIFTSSPRRQYIAEKIFKNLLPFNNIKVKFEEIRGNIETRLKKYNEQNIDGIILAKTAFDRLKMNGTHQIENEVKYKISKYINNSKWMILPLSCFPTAPGQGAIGIEANNKNSNTIKIIKKINNQNIFDSVEREKAILNIYGGGCHQKIGVSIWRKDNLELESITGKTHSGEKLLSHRIVNQKKNNMFENIKKIDAYPILPNDKKIFTRKNINATIKINKIRDAIIYITRKNVLVNNPRINESNIIWTSGVTTWIQAANKGYWINGSSDSLGEQSNFDIDSLLKNKPKLFKLTHNQNSSESMKIIPTYELHRSKTNIDINNKTHFFWMSSFAYDEAIKINPIIESKFHGCGPGKTYDHIFSRIKNKNNIRRYLSYKDWLSKLK